MESSAILQDFLLSEASLEGFLSYKQLAKLMKGQSEQMIRQVYDQLSQQRHHVMQDVEASIKDSFDIPLDEYKSELNREGAGRYNGKSSLSSLLERLKKLRDTMSNESDLLDTQIAATLADLQAKIDGLSSLQYSNSWVRGGNRAGVDSVVQDSISSVRKCDALINGATT
ncbi:hypothetical protein ABC855_g4045 [[Candida] zeylanoides]